jgi:hypothetical protein
MELNKLEAIKKARKAVEKVYGDSGRKWLVGEAPDSYDNPHYRTEIHVLEGSPPKGYVAVFGHHNCGVVIAFDSSEKRIHKWVWQD